MNDFINTNPRAFNGFGPGDWSTEMQTHRRALDARLDELSVGFSSHVPALGRAMTEAATAPGKRFRGVLMAMLAARMGALSPAVIEAACAVEMVHTASLIVDDLPSMDGALLRRGRPTTHAAHGEGRAILAAIALLSESFRLLAAIPGLDSSVRAAMVQVLAEAIGPAGLCAGQDLDLHNVKTLGTIAVEQDLKTGQLFDAAFRLVALLQGCDAARTARLVSVSRMLGRVFQSYDDLVDVAPPLGRADKTAGLDRLTGGPDKGLLAVADAAGARSHYRAMRRALDGELSGLWFDAHGLAAYVAAVLPDDAPAQTAV